MSATNSALCRTAVVVIRDGHRSRILPIEIHPRTLRSFRDDTQHTTSWRGSIYQVNVDEIGHEFSQLAQHILYHIFKVPLQLIRLVTPPPNLFISSNGVDNRYTNVYLVSCVFRSQQNSQFTGPRCTGKVACATAVRGVLRDTRVLLNGLRCIAEWLSRCLVYQTVFLIVVCMYIKWLACPLATRLGAQTATKQLSCCSSLTFIWGSWPR